MWRRLYLNSFNIFLEEPIHGLYANTGMDGKAL